MKYVEVSIAVPDDLYEKIDAIGAPYGVEINEVIRDILWRHIVSDLTNRLYDPTAEILDV